MNRRTFIKGSGLAAAGLIGGVHLIKSKPAKTHLFSLSFDDGFEKSFIKTAEIYEKYDLSACFNIIATAHLNTFQPPDDYIQRPVLGDFSLWNELQERNHEIMPHGYNHTNLTEIPLKEAKDLISKSLDYFGEHLTGFDRRKAVFNFPFNASNPAIESWLGEQVMAYRTAGELINDWPDRENKRLTCISHGPDNIDDFLTEKVNHFLDQPGGWFIFNTHGLDGEGWGPMSSGLLDELLARLVELEFIDILPVGKAYELYG